jgi:hypothetical protein
MSRISVPIVTAALVLSAQLVSAQDLSRYRDYVLGSSVASVAAASGVRAADARTLHHRPATIQELEWRTPYVSSDAVMPDPVRGAVFAFVDDALYQIVVRYERERTDGLTNADVIEPLTAIYGAPLLKPRSTQAPVGAPDTLLLARWESADSSVALVRGSYSPEYQLIFNATALTTRARDAIRESGRLNAVEAPRREQERRKQELADIDAARARSRTANKAAFRP